jgi:hypothetical protein
MNSELRTPAGRTKTKRGGFCLLEVLISVLCGFILPSLELRAVGAIGHPVGENLQQAASRAVAKKASLLSVRLLPETVTLRGARSTQHFLVLGKYADGLERDVTAVSRFVIVDPGVAQMSAPGRIMSQADGTTLVKAEFEGRVAHSTVRVEDVQKERLPTFARAVEAILTRHGCSGSNCHGGVKGRGGFKLSLNGAYPREDYRWILEGGTFQVLTDESSGSKVPRIDLKEPEKSLLLLKPTFSVPHGGGGVLCRGLRRLPDAA